jgi:uncharacterized protein YbjT (DUF2867 family)
MSGNGRILVTGATGDFGSALTYTLLAAGANIRVLEHQKPVPDEIKDAGVEVVLGDLMVPETLDAALDDVDRVFLYTPLNPDAAKMASNAISAAKRSGSPHIVRLSERPPDPVSNLRVGRLHVETDAELKASGLPYTFLRPTQVMQVTLFSVPSIASDGMIYMPYKDGKLSLVDIRDVAEAGALVLTNEGHNGKSYVLTGPASISFYEVAAGLSSALEKEVNYVNVPLEAARESMLAMGLEEWFAGAFLEYMENFSNGGGDFVADDFEKLTGHAPHTFDSYARDFAQYFTPGAAE